MEAVAHDSQPSPSPSEGLRILKRLEAARERYVDACGGGDRLPLLSPEQQELVKAALTQHRDNSEIRSIAMSAVSIGGYLCAAVGMPRVLPNGAIDFLNIESSEQLLFEDAIDIALDLTSAWTRHGLEIQHAMREAEAQAERDRLEAEAATRRRKVQAARDARWSHLTPTAQAAFRLAAKHPSGAIAEFARALIASETESRWGELELPDELDSLLWRLTADKLTDEQRELVGLGRK